MPRPILAVDTDGTRRRESAHQLQIRKGRDITVSFYTVNVAQGRESVPCADDGSLYVDMDEYRLWMLQKRMPNDGYGLLSSTETPVICIRTTFDSKNLDILEQTASHDRITASRVSFSEMNKMILDKNPRISSELMFRENYGKLFSDRYGMLFDIHDAFSMERTYERWQGRCTAHFLKQNNLPYLFATRQNDGRTVHTSMDRAKWIANNPSGYYPEYVSANAPVRYPESRVTMEILDHFIQNQNSDIDKDARKVLYDEGALRRKQDFLNNVFYNAGMPLAVSLAEMRNFDVTEQHKPD